MNNQVEALENTTNYLKKQLTSTIDNYQSSLKEIREMKEVARSRSKLTLRTPYTSRSHHSSRGNVYERP